MRAVVIGYLILTLVFVVGGQPLHAQDRFALVIGNAKYERDALANPANDANAVAARLREMGFEVQAANDLERAQIFAAVREFRQKLKPNAIAFVFYAGHAVEFDGKNYLIGVNNGHLRTREDVQVDGFPLNNLVEQIQASGTQLNVVVIDACRDAPLPAISRGASRGLVSIDTHAGTLLAYATSPGRTADDGDGQHSPYTTALLQQLGQPDLRVLDMFNNVGLSVVQATGNRQVPWASSSPVPNLVLAFGGAITATAPAVAPQPFVSAPVAQPVRKTIDDDWAPANRQVISMTSGISITIRSTPSAMDLADKVAARLGRLQMRVRLEEQASMSEQRSTFYFDPTQTAAMEVIRSTFVGIVNPQLAPSSNGMILVIQ